MDADLLVTHLHYIQKASSYSLSVEEKAALASSLLVLKKNNRLDKVQLIGKIFGTSNDYLIAQGFSTVYDFTRKTFCSTDGTEWVQLPDTDKQLIDDCAKIRQRFSGILSSVYQVGENGDEEEEEDLEGEDAKQGKTITEEQRLAVAVNMLIHDAAVVPRGAYQITTTGEVMPNRSFGGLSPFAACEAGSYLHLRQPETVQFRTLLEAEKLDKSLDFLDAIVEDIPEGVWSVQDDGAAGVIVLRCLRWPGFNAYHVPKTNQFGFAYFGTGERNEDIAFQL